MTTNRSCSWCHAMNAMGPAPVFCAACGHRADSPRMECDCPECLAIAARRARCGLHWTRTKAPVGCGPLVEQFTIRPPTGPTLEACLYRVPSRRTGRRIVVRDERGEVLYDTDDCYDLGNATAKLDDWLTQYLAGQPAAARELEPGDEDVRLSKE